MARTRSDAALDALVAALEIDLGIPICIACLGIVSSAVGSGDRRRIASELRCMTPDLWHEGLAEPALAAVRRAVGAGVEGAPAALADLERRGGRSDVARRIVLRLATELHESVRRELDLLDAARSSLHGSAPELN